jgi:hypothetical protein
MRDEHEAVGIATDRHVAASSRAQHLACAQQRSCTGAAERRHRARTSQRTWRAFSAWLCGIAGLPLGKRRGWRVLADLLHRTCGAEGMESPCGGSALLILYSCGRLSGGRTRHEHGCGVPTGLGGRLGRSGSADSGRFAVRPRRELCKLLTHGFCRHYVNEP